MTNILHTNYRDEYETPPEFFAALNKVFRFQLDMFSSRRNALCVGRWTKETSQLEKSGTILDGWVWANPPYGKAISEHLVAVLNLALTGRASIVSLLPANTDTGWFHSFVLPWAHVVWIKGRLQFLLDGKRPINPKTGKPSGNTGGNMLAIYGPNLLRCNAIDTEGNPIR